MSWKKTTVCQLQKRFRGSCYNFEDDLRIWCFSSSTTDENVQRVREIFGEDKQISIDAIASELWIWHRTDRSILHDDLFMHSVCLHMVPKMLSLEQNEVRMNAFRHLIDMANENNIFLKKPVTSDMTWFVLSSWTLR